MLSAFTGSVSSFLPFFLTTGQSCGNFSLESRKYEPKFIKMQTKTKTFEEHFQDVNVADVENEFWERPIGLQVISLKKMVEDLRGQLEEVKQILTEHLN